MGVGILLVLTLVGSVPPTGVSAAQFSLAPSALSLSIIPSKLPADNNTYPAVVVSVIDLHGQPTAALTDIHVSLTASQENVGRVAPSVVIPTGQTYAIANFTTTHSTGSTAVTATTSGLASASTAVTTVIAVGYPTHLVITAVPKTVPARPSNIGFLILELEDDVGLPAKAIADTSISLYSSNTNVVSVIEATTTMKQGEYLKEVNYTSGFVPGTAAITASAAGFLSGSATISVLGFPALALKLLAQPSTMVACASIVASCTGRLVVALTDLNGNPTRTTRDIQVQIRSSDQGVVNASETAIIKAGDITAIASYVVVDKLVGAQPDLVTITASSPGLQSGFAPITILNPNVVSQSVCGVPPATICSLQIFAGPNPVVADHRSYSSVVVSMFSSPLAGASPAVNSTGPTRMTLTSSLTGVGNFTTITFDIPKGQNWAAVTFTSTFQIGATVLTASAQNFLPIQTSLATYGPVPSNVVLSAISSILPADGASHPALELALEDAFGSPAIAPFDVPVNLTSSQSGIVKVSPTIIPSGQTFAIVSVTAGISRGTANLTALESSFTTGYASSSTLLSTVIPAPSALSVVIPNGGAIMSTPFIHMPLLAIQLQDATSNPARARTPVNVTITSSNSTVIPSVITALIDVGQDYTAIPIISAVPGTTTLTLSSPGLSPATTAVNFLPYPVQVTMSGGPKAIFTNQTAIISVSFMIDGSPVPGATVLWSASSGGLIVAPHAATASSSTSTVAISSTGTSTTSRTTTAAPIALPKGNDTTDTTGGSAVVFKPSKTGSATIVALVNGPGVPAKTLNFTVTVTAPPPSSASLKAKPSLTQELTSFPYVLAPIGGAGGAVLAAFLIRRRGKGGGGEESFEDSIG